MNNDTQFDKISALLDSDLDESEMNALLEKLNTPEGREAWATYHLIGDALRSDDLATPMSADFGQRFAERFASEPILITPAQSAQSNQRRGAGWRRYLPAYSLTASVAAALFAFLALPQWVRHDAPSGMQAWNRTAPASASSAIRLASVDEGVLVAANSTTEDRADKNAAEKNKPSQVEMLRNPDLDSYLIAHQRFSPAISNGAQYTRANAVATNPEK